MLRASSPPLSTARNAAPPPTVTENARKQTGRSTSSNAPKTVRSQGLLVNLRSKYTPSPTPRRSLPHSPMSSSTPSPSRRSTSASSIAIASVSKTCTHSRESTWGYITLSRAEKNGKVLPKWWDNDARKECVQLGLKKGGGSELVHALQKGDVQEQYGDNFMPMKLRVLAEKIYGKSVMG